MVGAEALVPLAEAVRALLLPPVESISCGGVCPSGIDVSGASESACSHFRFLSGLTDARATSRQTCEPACRCAGRAKCSFSVAQKW